MLRSILFALLPLSVFCQSKPAKTITLTLQGGSSFASTGDARGFYISAGAEKANKRWNFGVNLTNTLHDDVEPLFYQVNGTGQVYDGSLRSVTGGVQLQGLVSYSIVKSQKHALKFGLGPVLRYQSTSIHDIVSTYYPAATGFPVPVLVLENKEPMRTFAVGPVAQLGYSYSIKNNWVVGINASFQLDTNGDNFFNKGLMVGYRL